MAVLQCKSCGAPLTVEPDDRFALCGYCNMQQTIPTADDEFKLQMFNQANELRRQFDFDGAKSFLQAVVAKSPKEPEAYWQICLCKYGIMYVEDQRTLERIPTFYRMVPGSILADEDYKKACEYAGVAAWKYEEEAEKIEQLQRKISHLACSGEPYDIFICYKKTDPVTGAQTEDSRIASQIYMKLIESGYRVFWAERSLPAGCEYEPYIYSALLSSQIMLVLGTNPQFYEADWVKNEWIRFLDMMARNPQKTIITCYKNMSAEQIPQKLQSLQAMDMGDMLFSGDLLDRIERKLPKNKKEPEMDTNALYQAFQSFQQQNAPASQKQGEGTGQKELELMGGVYLGDAIAGKPHGYGVHHLPNGDRYDGHWYVGKHHGQGTMFYQNGDSWQGEWKDGIPLKGNGKFHFTNNNTKICWEGPIENGKLCGEGKIVVNGKITREGTFLEGRLHGQGTAYMENYKCTGEFQNGEPYNAQGVAYVLDGSAIYRGIWVNGKVNGNGRLEFRKDKRVIEGIFENGFNGEVTTQYSDGRRYEGAIQNGKLHGKGKMLDADGNVIYEGDYQNGSPDGYGILYYKDSRYEGEFVNGKRNGQGTVIYPEGSWTGTFQDDCKHTGNGLIFFYDDNGNRTGKFYNGAWENGCGHGRGVLRFEDGTRFDGEFREGECYTGYYYSAQNKVLETYINGENITQKNAARNLKIANTALDILSRL